jgi:hypothetical protein
LTAPANDLTIRLGDAIPAQSQGTNIPADAEVVFFLSNEADGGTIRTKLPEISMEFDELRSPSGVQVFLDTANVKIPNQAWPRTFQLEVEVDTGSLFVRATAPGTICVQQDFEIVETETVGYLCAPSTQPRPRDLQLAHGLVVKWIPGGCLPEVSGTADFWLSADGEIPADGTEDTEHQLLLQREMFPDQLQQEYVSYLVFDELQPGNYGIVVAIHPLDGSAPSLVSLGGTQVEICPGS